MPDCDLSNPAAQDLRGSGGDLCGVMSNTRFGTDVLTNNFNPAILNGWGIRPSDWYFTASIQQKIGPRSSADVTYTGAGSTGTSWLTTWRCNRPI